MTPIYRIMEVGPNYFQLEMHTVRWLLFNGWSTIPGTYPSVQAAMRGAEQYDSIKDTLEGEYPRCIGYCSIEQGKARFFHDDTSRQNAEPR